MTPWGHNKLHGAVTDVSRYGDLTVVRVQLDHGPEIACTVSSDTSDELSLTVGARVAALVRSTSVVLGREAPAPAR